MKNVKPMGASNMCLLTAIKTVKSWGLNVEITGLWIDENWRVCEV